MKRIITFGLFLVSISFLSSCNIAAVATYLVSPDPSKGAMYQLQNVPTVVFVDDRRNVMHPVRLRRVVAEQITDVLLEKNLLKTMIAPRDVMRVSAMNDKYNSPMPVAELGRAVGASVVIYVEMTAFGLTSDGQTANPRASCNVRVIDAVDNIRLFPIETSSFSVNERMNKVGPNRVTNSSDARELAEELAVLMGEGVSKVFYEHTTGRLGENLQRK